MRGALTFRLAGIPVSVDATFVVVALVFGVGRRSGISLVGWVVAVLVSVLIHELGHAVAFRAFGQSPRIRLWAWGGLTYGSAPLSPARDVVVSVAGSATAIALLGLPAYLVTRTTSFTSFAAYLFWHDLVWVSLGWSVLNLLPLLPLDGGNVARASLRRAMGERGDVMALWLSTAIASIGAVWALVVERQPFLAMYGVFFAGYSVEQLIERRDAPFRDELAAAARQLSDDPDAAAATAKRVLAAARGRAMLTEAGEIAAWAALARDDAREALEMIRQMGSTARPTPALQGCAALVTGERDRGLRLLSAAMVERPTVYLGPIAMRCIVGASAVDELASALLGRRGEEGPNAAATLALGMHLIGRYDAAISVAEGVYADGRARRATVAYNAACSAARSGSADRAIRWLEAAIANGFDKAEMLDEDDDLDSLRGMPAFKRLMTSAPSTPPTR